MASTSRSPENNFICRSAIWFELQISMVFLRVNSDPSRRSLSLTLFDWIPATSWLAIRPSVSSPYTHTKLPKRFQLRYVLVDWFTRVLFPCVKFMSLCDQISLRLTIILELLDKAATVMSSSSVGWPSSLVTFGQTHAWNISLSPFSLTWLHLCRTACFVSIFAMSLQHLLMINSSLPVLFPKKLTPYFFSHLTPCSLYYKAFNKIVSCLYIKVMVIYSSYFTQKNFWVKNNKITIFT